MDFLNQTNIQWGSYAVTPWTAVPSTVMYNATLGVFTTVFDTNIPNSGYLYAKYDLSGGCGYIYFRTPNPVLGKIIEIGYYPAPAVIGLTGDYSREWYNESSSSSMTLTEGLLTEEELPNKEFVLTIYNATRWTTGSYSVKCTKSTTDSLYTERVYVKVIVPPGQPFLQSKRIVQDCPKCLVQICTSMCFAIHLGALSYIYLDDEKYNVNRDPPWGNIYRISRFIRAEDYMKTVTCSVLNAALKKPLTTSAKLFVALKPEIPVLNVPILREGSPANITCISRGGRPAANLNPPTMLTMDAPSIPRYLQDSYTLKFSCFTDTYNDNCLVSWTKDSQLDHANGEVTNKTTRLSFNGVCGCQ
ncbi:hypothetical protein MAR_028728 [Mya arenaria]|uniref:Ig-like domain-containing protein n=1 Tax=Mya arenaria TaxID=6604 RepID=A0ABY7DGH7_MYAAR|nr:hypothetical protein MAR_028728 [Mya arenaria]